ncbi:MAG: phytanoyl-CoA dioxygenase family protein [Bacteroidia bacterium]|nr:phytanoyl-CoA dioxygenase family protein [Bacteroidia bacterium]
MVILKKYWNVLRRLRFLHLLNNIANYSVLKKNKLVYKKFNVDKSVVSSISSRDLKNTNTDIPWLDQSDALGQINKSKEFKQFDNITQQQLLLWIENGYLILKNFIPPTLINCVNADLEQLIKNGKVDFDYTNSRVMNLYRHSEAAKKIVTDERLINILSFTLGKKIIPFQSINFIYGSQQKTHSDSIHMTTHPPGYLIAIWVALEDLEPDCGLLHYYPGSHKLPYIMSGDFNNSNTSLMVGDDFYENYEKKIAETILEKKLTKKIFAAKKGDLLIWHANLLHGGEPRLNTTATRKSLVAHYFCEGDVINYHEITQRPAVIKNTRAI